MKKGKGTHSDRILIIIPFWEGDKPQAIMMAKLLADLEPRHSDRADLLFVRRFDCKPLPEQAIKYISRKFNIFQHRSARKETGWPAGCNGIFAGALEYVYHMSEAGRIPRYKAYLNMASDVVPLVPDWIEYLHQQWKFLPANLRHPVTSAGALIPGEHEHINGDIFLFSGDLDYLNWIKQAVGSVRVRAGWDWVLADKFREQGWANIPGVISLWGTKTMDLQTAQELRRKGTVMLHGVKDDSLLNHARKMML